MTEAHTLNKADLRQFTGSEHWYRHGLARNVVFTGRRKIRCRHGGSLLATR